MYLANFKKYWREHLAHLAVGFIIGISFGIPLALLVCKRQDLEYQKRDDTPGIDLAYHVGGAAVGTICLAFVVWMVWRLLIGV